MDVEPSNTTITMGDTTADVLSVSGFDGEVSVTHLASEPHIYGQLPRPIGSLPAWRSCAFSLLDVVGGWAIWPKAIQSAIWRLADSMDNRDLDYAGSDYIAGLPEFGAVTIVCKEPPDHSEWWELFINTTTVEAVMRFTDSPPSQLSVNVYILALSIKDEELTLTLKISGAPKWDDGAA